MTESEILKFILGGGILTSLIKVIYGKLSSDLKELYKKIEKQDEKIDALELTLAQKYTTREDFKESTTHTSKKLDRVLEIIAEKKSKKKNDIKLTKN